MNQPVSGPNAGSKAVSNVANGDPNVLWRGNTLWLLKPCATVDVYKSIFERCCGEDVAVITIEDGYAIVENFEPRNFETYCSAMKELCPNLKSIELRAPASEGRDKMLKTLEDKLNISITFTELNRRFSNGWTVVSDRGLNFAGRGNGGAPYSPLTYFTFFEPGQKVPESMNEPTVPYKSELCTFFAENRCAFGKNCTYAHGTSELRSPWAKDPNYKTQSCDYFSSGHECPQGVDCGYLHNETQKQADALRAGKPLASVYSTLTIVGQRRLPAHRRDSDYLPTTDYRRDSNTEQKKMEREKKPRNPALDDDTVQMCQELEEKEQRIEKMEQRIAELERENAELRLHCADCTCVEPSANLPSTSSGL